MVCTIMMPENLFIFTTIILLSLLSTTNANITISDNITIDITSDNTNTTKNVTSYIFNGTQSNVTYGTLQHVDTEMSDEYFKNAMLVSMEYLQRLKALERGLGESVDVDSDLLCNCSEPRCDSELRLFIGASGLCRSISGVCFKRLRSDLSVVYGCLANGSKPELFCAARQPAYDGSVMACCRNVSFCNAHLHLKLNFQSGEEIYVKVFIAFCITLFILLLLAGLMLSSILIRSRLKRCMTMWRYKSCNHGIALRETGTDDLLLSSTSENLTHLSNLLSNLDDSFNTGSGSGLPLLVQRTIARQIELQCEIGRGRFGEVWLGTWKGDMVAVKIFTSRDERSWNGEVEIFQTNLLRHPNILRFIASDNKDAGTCTELWLVTEYHEFGSLYDYFSENTVTYVEMLQMIRSIANGLSFLHIEIPGIHSKPAIAHRDLKSRNILVKNDLTCVIADLGLSVRYVEGEINIPNNNKCGTIRYLSPEVLEDSYQRTLFDSYKMSDVYSFGLIIWEIATRCVLHSQPYILPYWDSVGRDPSFAEMRTCVCDQKQRPKLQPSWQNDSVMVCVSQIMQECWAAIPSARLTAMNVRNMVDKIVSKHGYKIHT